MCDCAMYNSGRKCGIDGLFSVTGISVQHVQDVISVSDPQELTGSIRGTFPNTLVQNAMRSCQTWTLCRSTSWTASTRPPAHLQQKWLL